MPTQTSDIAVALHGVYTIDLIAHGDHRGAFTELFRQAWIQTPEPVQWNAVRSVPHTLRGVHVHLRHADYLTAPLGRAIVAMKDLRQASPTRGHEARVVLEPAAPKLLYIPPGVAHGFYFPIESLHVYAVSEYFNRDDELGYAWDDPEAALFPEVKEPLLSPRDETAQSFQDLLNELKPHQSKFYP